MRVGVFALALILTVVGCGITAAQDDKRAETITGLVRTMGAQAGIMRHCRSLYTVDDAVSDGLASTVRQVLDKTLGRQQAQAAIDVEGLRVNKEIAEIGAEQWCSDQRDILNTDSVRVFVD